MGFFFESTNSKSKTSLMGERFGCAICPLQRLYHTSPNMKPTGSDKPIVYLIGEAPGATEDFENEQFIGESGTILRNALKEVADDHFIRHHIRWNNVVRCRPYIGSSNRTPTQLEIDCCRKSIIEDIEETKPVIIIGFGSIPLKFFTTGKQIGMWRGRIVPIKVGSHICWYSSSYHPSFLVGIKKNSYENEFDKCFKADLSNALNFILNNYEDPIFIDSGFEENIECITKATTENLNYIGKKLIKFGCDGYATLDIETNLLKPYYPDSKILTIAIGNDNDVIAFPIDYPNFWNDEQKKELDSALYSFFMSNSSKIAHNLKFELEWFFKRYNNQSLLRESEWEDTMLQAYMLDERTSKEEGMLSLDSLTSTNFGFNLKEKSPVDRKNIMKSKLSDILLYNGMDTKYTHKLFSHQRKKLTGKLLDNYRKTIETTKTLVLVQNYGVNVDNRELEYYENFFLNEIKECEDIIYSLPEVKEFEEMTHHKLDILSNNDLVIVFRDILRFKEIKQTKKAKKFALDDEVMGEYAEKYNSKLAKMIQEYRTLVKMKSNYVDNVRGNLIGDMIHPSFSIVGTSTGRFSSGKEGTT
jgi:DNA polymerase